MIVEYLGVPGCGKTYQANLYKIELTKKRIPFIDLSRWKGTPFWLKVFYKVTEKTFVLIPKYRRLRNRLVVQCHDVYDKQPRYLPFSVEYCINRIISSVILQDVFGKCKRIAINDEGLMQWVVFLNLQYDIDIKDILTVLRPLNPNSKTIYISTKIETAFTNIKKRNRHICPMDEMNDDDLKHYLKEFEDVCSNNLSFFLK